MDVLTRMAGEIGQLLKDKGQTVAVSETSAGGLVSAALLAVPGASAYYMARRGCSTPTIRGAFFWGLPEGRLRGNAAEHGTQRGEAGGGDKRQAGIDMGRFRNGGRGPCWKQIRGRARTFVHGRFPARWRR